MLYMSLNPKTLMSCVFYTKRVVTWIILIFQVMFSEETICCSEFMKKYERKRSWILISYLFFYISQSCFLDFCLNYWFVEKATRVHCGLCQSQTIVYHYSTLFFRQASFFGQGQTTFESPRGRRVLVRRGQNADRFCLVHSTFILKKSAFCWLVYLHTQVWPKHFTTEGTVERLFNFWRPRDGGFLALLSYDWSIWQP